MRIVSTFITAALLSAGSAHADISDSGNLTINGQGVILGTMTVSGNAFSVGGSTFSINAGKVGVGTASPAATLDVNGNAQFGSGVTKSTFTSTGLLKLTSSGIQWADGSTSTTTASGGSAPTGGNNTWTGLNTFSSTVYFSSAAVYQQGSIQQYGDGTNTNPLNIGQEAYPMKSVDGVSESSGCVVVVLMNTNNGSVSDQMTFTSTTTIQTRANSGGVFGVLLESCAPGAICRVGIHGIYRVKADSSGIPAGDTASLSTTRCALHPNNLDDSNTVGYVVHQPAGSVGANNMFWMYLKN